VLSVQSEVKEYSHFDGLSRDVELALRAVTALVFAGARSGAN